MAGILDYNPEDARMNAFYQGLLNAGAAMGAGGGPSTTPGSGMAGALTQGLGAFGQGYRGAMQENQAAAVNAYKMEQMKQAVETQRRKQAAYDAYVNQTIPLTGEAGPTVQAAQAGQAMLPKIPGLTPEIARTMDPDAFSKYVLEMNAERAKRTMDVEYEPLKAGAIEQAKNAPLLARKAGEGEIEYNQRMRTEAGLNPIMAQRAGQEASARLPALQTMADYNTALDIQAAGAKKFAEKTAEGQAARTSPETQRANQDALAALDISLRSANEVLNHPGLSSGTGTGAVTLAFVPGTSAKDFSTKVESLKAQTFLPMVEKMKGLGALTEAEGKKLTDAVGSLDTSMSKSAFESSVRQIYNDLHDARSRFVERTGINQAYTGAPSLPAKMVPPAPAGFVVR